MNNSSVNEKNVNEKKEKNMENFKKRVYGAIIVKSNLANYNADFTGSPRTLPDGTVYATDKVVKFKIRDYLDKKYEDEKIFVKTKYKSNGNPMTLEEVYKYHFGEPRTDKIKILNNLLSCLDVRLFGATFAMKGNDNINISIHGPVQISYGVNRLIDWKDSGMFTDQIGSPYANPKEGEVAQTTLGSQIRSFEAHYVHHFSINPKNLSKFVEQISLETLVDGLVKTKKDVLDKDETKKEIEKLNIGNNLKNEIEIKIDGIDKKNISELKVFLKEKLKKILEEKRDEVTQNGNFKLITNSDIEKLKESMQLAVTSYDSTSKKNVENEFLMWIEMKDNTVLRNFSELIEIEKETESKKTKINLEKVFDYLCKYQGKIPQIEIYYDENFTELAGIPNDWKKKDEKGNEVDLIKICGSIKTKEGNSSETEIQNS